MQLELFHRKVAVVFHFPLARQASLVRSTALQLSELNYEDGKRMWERHVQALRRQLKATGLPSKEIHAELTSYSRAVRCEFFRAHTGRVAGR